MRHNPGTRTLLKTIFMGFGLLGALAAGTLYLTAAMALARAERATGIVVAFSGTTPPHTQKGPPPQPTVAPVIAFTAADGQERRFTAGWYTSEPVYALGDRVPVLYRQDDPARAWIDSFAETWLLPVIASVISAVFLVVGLLMRGARPT